jgi:hypothetical protein
VESAALNRNGVSLAPLQLRISFSFCTSISEICQQTGSHANTVEWPSKLATMARG